MENHNLLWENSLQMVIFNSYVKLPEGNLNNLFMGPVKFLGGLVKKMVLRCEKPNSVNTCSICGWMWMVNIAAIFVDGCFDKHGDALGMVQALGESHIWRPDSSKEDMPPFDWRFTMQSKFILPGQILPARKHRIVWIGRRVFESKFANGVIVML